MSEDDKLLKEAKKLSWDERLLHKNWKVRIDANADLAAVFDSITDPKDHRFREIVPKAVVPAVDVMFQALREFGSKVIPPKRTLKMLPELFDHQDQNVQACSKGLTLELCRWVGKDPVKSILFEKMRDTMKKELEAELVNVTGTAKPTRKIRSAQDKVLEQDAMPTTACSGLLKNPLLTPTGNR
ncbi:unnamed protein product [Cuscuta campestris]|uniref:XMAP215/Dis1/CLASP TOG domain-containing protein n=1 Tax=Cuscuta campestris TaxID=132261 RepID=A0A484NBH5_9ASTE|nr:unnamed protein product [Cuscuta campestris]